MARTFSLRRLFVGVTALGVMCALAVQFPEAFAKSGLRIVIFLPVLVVATGWSAVSRRPRWTCGIAVAGGLVGYVLSPAKSAHYLHWFDRYSDELVTAMPFAVACAFLLGGAAAFITRRRSPRKVATVH
jgi:hypothetical protein